MISYKFVAVIIFGLVLAGIQSGVVNTCSNLLDKQPVLSKDCTSFNNATLIYSFEGGNFTQLIIFIAGDKGF